MGKSRRPKKKRQISRKWSFDLAKLKDKSWLIILQGLGLTAVIAFLFYRSVLGLLVGVIVIPFWYKLAMADKQAKRKVSVMLEFKEYMMLIVAALQTGYSLEKALKQSEVELKRLYSEESMLLPLVHVMNQKIGMNIQLRQGYKYR